jgi:hypothetical protein
VELLRSQEMNKEKVMNAEMLVRGVAAGEGYTGTQLDEVVAVRLPSVEGVASIVSEVANALKWAYPNEVPYAAFAACLVAWRRCGVELSYAGEAWLIKQCENALGVEAPGCKAGLLSALKAAGVI